MLGLIEAFGEHSFGEDLSQEDLPSFSERIAHAEHINGLPFERLETILFFKKRDRRDKDLQDIALIEEWIKGTLLP